MASAWGGSWGTAWGDSWGAINAAPTLLGSIPNLSAAYDSGTYQYDLSEYFSGATSYAIDPAVEAGWSFNTGTGILEIDTDAEDVFGPYVVTATNATGNTDSNAFTVNVYVSALRGFGWLATRLGIGT